MSDGLFFVAYSVAPRATLIESSRTSASAMASMWSGSASGSVSLDVDDDVGFDLPGGLGQSVGPGLSGASRS